jgi:hypothetical protein
MAKELASEMLCIFKNSDDGQSPAKKNIMSVNFSHALFSLLSTHDDLFDAGLALAPLGQVQNDSDRCCLVCPFICKFKVTSHTEA